MTGITIERDAHSQQFVIVHNRVARDRRLKRDARGLLVELLSLPDGVRVAVETLAENGPEGRDAIRRMLRDLEALGYISRTKERGAGGRWVHRLVIRETPNAAEPETENPSMVSPAETREIAGQTRDGFSGAGKPALKREVPTNLKTKKDAPPARSARAGAGSDAPAGAKTPVRYARTGRAA